MSNSGFRNHFSNSLQSLRLQMQTLLEGVGGSQTLHALDTLSNLSSVEQKIALGVFQRLLDKVLEGELRVESAEDQAFADFEEKLFQDIQAGIELEKIKSEKKMRFMVLQGGQEQQKSLFAKLNRDKTVQVDFSPRKRKHTSF
jgi:hypothetical protein